MISHRAAAVAVTIAFVTGLVGSLAIRSPGSLSAPSAIAGSGGFQPIAWRVPLSFNSTLPGLGDNPLHVSQVLREASDGAIDLQLFEPGEIVPPFSISDAVRDGKIPAGFTWLGYDQGKTAAAALLAAVPFGMEPTEFTAWWFEADGRALAEELYEDFNIHPVLCGLIGPETAGWFRERLDSLDDLKGLKIRFAGIGGKVVERLGASVTLIPGGEIFQALEKGAIDATEFSLPIVDQSLGFSRIAKYNYYPGWHQPATAGHFVINLDVWRALPAPTQALIETACTAGITRNLAQTEAQQGKVIAGYADAGVNAETLPMDVLRALEKVTEEILEEEAAKDPVFARILNSQRAFRADFAHWKRRAYLPRDF